MFVNIIAPSGRVVITCTFAGGVGAYVIVVVINASDADVVLPVPGPAAKLVGLIRVAVTKEMGPEIGEEKAMVDQA